MGQLAPRVCTESGAIRRLEALINQLPNNANVMVECEDGKQVTGIVCIRPTVQSLRNYDGVEGVNGVLRLEDADAPGGEHRIWLDQIRSVQRLISHQGMRAA